MQPETLWRVSVRCSPDAEEPTAALFERLFNQLPSIYVDEESQARTVAVYLPTADKPAGRLWKSLCSSLRDLREANFHIAHRSLQVHLLKKRDWADSWRRHFRPFIVGGRLLIKPSWSRKRAQDHQSVVVLDPGLAFGTGQHPTTSFCLQQLVRERPRPGLNPKSLLDIGTGSGILAISAAKLGYRPVLGMDVDPVCLKVASENARRNRVETKIQLRQQALEALRSNSSSRHDIVCANLIFDLLIAERIRITAQMAPEGRLILAGILKEQFPKVRRAYETLGFKLIREKSENEWTSGMFGRAAFQPPG